MTHASRVDAAVLRAVGFTELPEELEIVVGWRDVAHFYARRPAGIALLSLRVEPDGRGGRLLTFRHADVRNGRMTGFGTLYFLDRDARCIRPVMSTAGGGFMVETVDGPEDGVLLRISPFAADGE